MTQRMLALILAALQAVVALAPIALCEHCRESGSLALGFAKADCSTCQAGCCRETTAASHDGEQDSSTAGVRQNSSESSGVVVFGNPSSARSPRVPIDVSTLPVADFCSATIDLEATVKNSGDLVVTLPADGANPGRGAPALRC